MGTVLNMAGGMRLPGVVAFAYGLLAVWDREANEAEVGEGQPRPGEWRLEGLNGEGFVHQDGVLEELWCQPSVQGAEH